MNGGFKPVDDLKQVDGIGNATLENLLNNVSVTRPTTAVAPTTKNPVKATKPAQDIKVVGNDKVAASGKTTDAKVEK